MYAGKQERRQKAWHEWMYGWWMNEPDDFLTNTSSVLLPKQKSLASKIDVGLFTYTKQLLFVGLCFIARISET
jgi:hypothetical protein